MKRNVAIISLECGAPQLCRLERRLAVSRHRTTAREWRLLRVIALPFGQFLCSGRTAALAVLNTNAPVFWHRPIQIFERTCKRVSRIRWIAHANRRLVGPT